VTGGLSDKRGNWYEHDYVCWLWLQLLAELIESVQWEAPHEDEPGVDVWTTEAGQRIAHQCKSRSTGHWSPSALEAAGILRYARSQLERDGGAAEFRFVTTTSAPTLEELLRWARTDSNVPPTGTDLTKIARALCGRDDPTGAEVRRLLARVRVRSLGAGTLDDILHKYAAQLVARDEAMRLVKELRALRLPGVELRAEGLRKRLGPHDWTRTVDSRSVRERIEVLKQRFIDDTLGRRTIDPPLARSEPQVVLDLIRAGPEPQTILVHGGAGSGKSDILATVVQEWPAECGSVVPILAHESNELTAAPLTLDRLALFGERSATLLVDQLDQLLLAGTETQRHLRDLTRLVREARGLGMRLVIGSRSTEAEFDTQLNRLIHDGTGSVAKVEALPLPEDQVATVLSGVGVPWGSLASDVRDLVRKPICLGIALGLAADESWKSSRSIHDLVAKWWDSIAGNDVDKQRALDALIEQMEATGSMAVDSLGLCGHERAVEALVQAGVLERDSRSRLRPMHQVLVDMRMARYIGISTSTEAVLERLGPREEQDVHGARRIRHAVTLFVGRDEGGARILDGLFRCQDVRPLVKRALLLGLRDEGGRAPPALADVARAWLEEGGPAGLVSGILLHANPTWVTHCRNWISSSFLQANQEDEEALLRLLSSVSVQCGDLVAALLAEWSSSDPQILERAHWIFWHDPSNDSEALFRMRMQLPGSVGLRPYCDWKRLLTANAARAAVMLERILSDAEFDRLRKSRPDQGLNMPKAEDLESVSPEAAHAVWGSLRAWWLRVQLSSLRDLDTEDSGLPRAPLIDLVEILSTCLACQLEHGALTWDELLEDLPDSLRDLDGWLLLRTGARLDPRSNRVAAAAVRWIQENERFAELRIGWMSGAVDLCLLEEFAAAVVPCLTTEEYESFESWVLAYRESRIPRDPDYRFPTTTTKSDPWPTMRGVLAYRLLQVIPAGRLSERARAGLRILRNKFDPHWEELSSPPCWVADGPVRSKVTDEELSIQTPAQWLSRLRDAPEQGQLERDQEAAVSYSRPILIQQLWSLARADPASYVPVAEFLASADPPLDPNVYSSLLDAIAETSPPADVHGWTPAPDESVSRLLRHSAFLRAPECALGVGLAVEARPEHSWENDVVARLIEIASTACDRADIEPTGPIREEEDSLAVLQWRDTACVAVRALAARSAHDERLHERMLRIAEDLLDRGVPAVRAAAATLAMSAYSSAPERANAIVRTACDDLAVAASSLRILFFLVDRALAEGDEVESIRSILHRLPASTEPYGALQGGRALVALRCRGVTSLDDVRELLRLHPRARKGAAEEVGHWLSDSEQRSWILEYAHELANDEDVSVAQEMIRQGTSTRNRPLLRDPTFASGLVTSHGGRSQYGAEWLLMAMDEESNLFPMAEVILEHANAILDGEGRTDSLARYSEVRLLGGLLARLVEECEREGHSEERRKALNAWDRLIEAHPFETGPLLNELTR